MDLTELNKDRKKRRSSLDLGTMVYGKVPPQAKSLEEAVLGAIMIVRGAFDIAAELLKPECFYVEAHQRIFSAMQRLTTKSQPIDILTVAEELRSKEELEMVGGEYYVTMLTSSVVSDAHIVSHSRIIYQKYIQREQIRIGGEMIGDAYEDSTDPFDLLDLSFKQLQDLSNQIQEKKKVNIGKVSMEVITSLYDKAHNARNNVVDPNEIYTHLPEWDRVNGALFPALYVIAARPGMGKGIVMTEMICRAGMVYDIGVINGEMTNRQLLIRIGCNLKSINNELWKKDGKEITDDELKLVHESMVVSQGLKLHLEDSTYIHKICSKIRMWVQSYGVKMILVDFLGLIRVPEEIGKYWTEVQKINYIMDTLRLLSKELSVPIIIFAQLNRELYKRGGSKEPNLADLKGSGNIEEFAFQISFLHRPEYYDIAEDELGNSTKGLMYQIIAKHRDGELRRIKYKFTPWFSKIDNWDFQEVPGWKPIPKTSFDEPRVFIQAGSKMNDLPSDEDTPF